MPRKFKFAEWTTAEINDLPDSCFAYIEGGGKKDEEGKTTPRSLRHLPYKGADGKPDQAHVRDALSRLPDTKIPADAKPAIKKKLQDLLEKAKASDSVIGIIPLQFSENEDDDAGKDAQTVIPSVIHLIPTGQWDHPMYGPILITATDIHEFAQNFNAKVRKGVFITAGHEGMNELPAVGWVTEVYERADGLWGKVDWNESGKELLADKAFKFFSPEFYQTYEDPETQQIYRNVLTGGALTKSPYFKDLEAIVFSEPKQTNSQTTNTMDLQTLLAKIAADLTTEEKAYLNEHKAELSAEQVTALGDVIVAPAETEEAKAAREKTEADAKAALEAQAVADANVAAGLNADGTTKDQVQASEKVMISASELTMLRKKADEGALAFAELRAAKVGAEVDKLTFSDTNRNGRFLPKTKDALKTFMETLNESQRLNFASLVAAIPSAQVFGEKGNGNAKDADTKSEVDAKVASKMKDKPDMKYSEALKEVMSENKGLSESYDEEIRKK